MKNVIFDDDGMESMQNSLPPIIHCAFLSSYMGTADWDHHQKLCHWYSLHQMICTGSATEYLIILGNKRSRGPYDRINRHPPNCKRGLFLICAAGSYLTKRMAGRNVPPGMAVDTHQIFRSSAIELEIRRIFRLVGSIHWFRSHLAWIWIIHCIQVKPFLEEKWPVSWYLHRKKGA